MQPRFFDVDTAMISYTATPFLADLDELDGCDEEDECNVPGGWSRMRPVRRTHRVRKAYIRLHSRLGQDVVSTHKRVVGGRSWCEEHEATHT